ncbi:DUF815 domain-containing protein [Alkalibaculum sp. M08DMB]|uniref:DUF815 domain-containing protein n=1 Tax=Alkalibaculum sporogenes TaxID=2655001 RepID=A0A6A7K5R0_9FIRM|nr:ATP-binding protein [Alkalibaculum sporogenes]MPW24607.1 DUF815 domain-containing protein [Alkalibaculum sporogenes]
MHELDQLVVFRNIRENEILISFRNFIAENDRNYKIEQLFKLQYLILNHECLKVFSWKEIILKIILTDENIFSLKCENGDSIDSTLITLTTGDVKILRDVYNYDWINQLEELSIKRSTLFTLNDCRNSEYLELHNLFANENLGETFIVKELIKYLNTYGTGMYSKNYVFKWNDTKKLTPIHKFDQVSFSDLIGYERQINCLKENTNAFINKGKANNVLLYGQRGTGKSSSLKALASEYSSVGLRIIELRKKDIEQITLITDIIRERNYKFIIFIDDLSFEEFETDYKNFKAIIEGSFEKKPDNVLIYVTSNRRHLIRESFKDREEDVHSNETLQEKLSLFDRFGITILYDQPKDELYNEMVITLAERNGITLPKHELLRLANEWKISKSSKSGRTAQQLIDTLI